MGGFTNTELALELGLNPTPSMPTKKPSPSPDHPLEPSLTLALSADSCGGSSFSNASVKRERDVASDEEDGGVNDKKKLRLTKAQSGLLEEAFKLHTTLNPKQKQELARNLKLRPRQVEVWFQNRRARTKLKQTEVDCEYLKKCCKILTDENQRLRQEVQDLKAEKGSQPMYMQLPAATLTVCPSCEQIGDPNNSDSTKKFMALSASFSRAIYSEIEEIGWEHLGRLAEDLSFVTFRVVDKKERVHMLEILLDKSYPKCPPSVSADVPCLFNLEWSMNSRLKDVVNKFRQHLEKLQPFWSTVEDIDQSLWVSDSAQLHRATSFRHINIGNDCSIMLFICVNEPRSLPECRFLGSDKDVNLLMDKWRRNCNKWSKDKLFAENLANLLEFQLPGPPGIEENDKQTECGICYSQFLPMMNLDLKVEAEQIIHVKIVPAANLFIEFALGIGYVPSQQQGSHLMLCLVTALIALSQLPSKPAQENRSFLG
ncbi:hypothetical protein E3N88_02488 [Mikania micrantha]|uniref:Homeobox domain-containing protein n=1 Tax=Mikania micrantha TaxID=192012 RepID=A0A5N6Q444_9ASTR|nr:hypothetical protein E3N88_02488 [Mikania micrantha]